MKKLVLLAMFALAAAQSRASTDGYFMFSVFAPGQLPSYMTDVKGMRLSLIYGDCQTLTGLDVGLAGRVRERMYGAQVAIYNRVGTDANGLQIALWNRIDSDFKGLEIGAANMVEGHTGGVALGLVNASETVSGVQIGLVNIAEVVKGVQIGLVNRISTQTCGDWQVWFTPIFNAGW